MEAGMMKAFSVYKKLYSPMKIAIPKWKLGGFKNSLKTRSSDSTAFTHSILKYKELQWQSGILY